MALEDILEAIRADTDADIAVVLADARERAAAVTERAAAEAEKEVKAVVAAAVAEARAEAERIVVAAQKATAELYDAAAEQLYRDTLDVVKEQLAELRSSPQYPAVFAALAAEARDRLGRATEIRVDPADEHLAGQYADEAGRNGDTLQVTTSLTTIGGVVIADGARRTAVNTLEARLLASDGLMRAMWARDAFGVEAKP